MLTAVGAALAEQRSSLWPARCNTAARRRSQSSARSGTGTIGRSGRREVATAAVLAAGLTLFLVAATPAEATTSPADHLPVLVTVLAIGVAVSGAVWLGRQSSGSVSAAAVVVWATVSLSLLQPQDEPEATSPQPHH